MSLLSKITISISKESLKSMIQKQLEDEGYVVKSIDFEIKKNWVGYGPGEHEVTDFNEVVCVVEKK